MGYEISPDAFALRTKKTRDDLRYAHGNLFDDAEAEFDVVMAIVEDYFGFLRNLRKKRV